MAYNRSDMLPVGRSGRSSEAPCLPSYRFIPFIWVTLASTGAKLPEPGIPRRSAGPFQPTANHGAASGSRIFPHAHAGPASLCAGSSGLASAHRGQGRSRWAYRIGLPTRIWAGSGVYPRPRKWLVCYYQPQGNAGRCGRVAPGLPHPAFAWAGMEAVC